MSLDIEKYPSLVILLASLASCLIAQTSKIFINLIRYRKLDLSTLIKTGGMPSSHSAMVTSLATGVALIDGLQSTQFALATCFALIVMYDASGVRRSVGIQATILNQMIVELTAENPQLKVERIKEFLGHTPFEVVVGACLGILIGYEFCHSFGMV